MGKGTVKWFNTKNGLGLIVSEDGEKVRFHFSTLADGDYKTLKAGDAVEFEAKPGRRGPEATSVTRN